jgi:hypothetical protein
MFVVRCVLCIDLLINCLLVEMSGYSLEKRYLLKCSLLKHIFQSENLTNLNTSIKNNCKGKLIFLCCFRIRMKLSITVCPHLQASTLTYFSTCPFGQLTKKSTCPTQSFSCPKKLIKITKTRENNYPGLPPLLN